MGRYTNPRIRVYNDALTLQGTLTNVIHAEYSCKLNEIGEGHFIIPLVDTPARQYITINNVAIFTVEISSTETAFGGIIITDVDDQTRAAAGLLVVSGPGFLHKLTYDRMAYNLISDGAGGKSTTARVDVLALSQYTWGVQSTQYATPRVGGAYWPSANETLFQGLLYACAQDNIVIVDRPLYPPAHTVHEALELEQLDPTKTTGNIDFKMDADDTVLTDVPIPDGKIKIINDRSQVPTRVYVSGGGSGQDRFTIADANGIWSPPSGFSADYTNSIVINDDMETAIGIEISDDRKFPSIHPEDETTTAAQTAAVQLCEAGLTYLLARQESNHTFYEITDTIVGTVVWPGSHYCTITYDETSPYDSSGSEVTTTIIDVDINTHILQVKYWFGQESVLKCDFVLGPAARTLQDGASETSGRIENIEQRLDHLAAFASVSAPGGDPTYAPSDSTFVVVTTDTDLTQERALAAGTGISLTDGGANNNITINNTGQTSQIDNLAFVTIGNTASLSAERALTAGDGLDLTDGGANSTVTLAVDVTDILGDGLTETSNNLVLGTPSTLTGATTNSVTTTSHTHAVSLNHSDIGGQTDSDHHPPVTLGGDISPLMSIGAGQILTFDTQTANTFLAGPTSGSAADPSMRALVIDDFPATAAASMLFSAIKRLPGLVAFYPMSHVPSNQLTDVIGGFHMTNNNTSTFNADTSYRNYVTLNGTNQYFSIADGSFTEISGTETYIATAMRGLTIMAAVRFDSAATPATPEFIVAKRASTAGTRGYGLQRNGNGTIGGTVHNGTTENAVNTSQTLGGSTWGFVCFRYDPSSFVKVRLDANSDAQNTTSIISSIQNNSEAFTIGARSNGAGGGTLFAGADIGWVAISRMVVQDEWVDLIQTLSDKVY